MEIDWSVGQILAALDECGVDDNTMVLFTSDNGPWLNFGDHAGSAGPLREGKGTMFEGGYRVPCVVRWPTKIPAGSKCDELASTIDLLPTVAHLIGGELPRDRTIDGHNIWPLLSGDADTTTPRASFYCYYNRELRAVRNQRYKLHLPHKYRTLDGRPGGTGGKPVAYSQKQIGLELYDLDKDPGETTDVASEHPEIVSELLEMAELARADLGDRLTGAKGANVRPCGRVEAADALPGS